MDAKDDNAKIRALDLLSPMDVTVQEADALITVFKKKGGAALRQKEMKYKMSSYDHVSKHLGDDILDKELSPVSSLAMTLAETEASGCAIDTAAMTTVEPNSTHAAVR
uniref:Uncharacterized protein n=1 Tax=Odontella aurita TaxID=265563 RepID=A0A7S4JJ15_9STRA|mmetsp:Transcript_47240/g.143043  ORF Transcript_47240/g.143043 Transcript_47240/m.143043 type:complete len:108 (+) Transcript_47240:954-1277(+)